jgi:hypothetical protein
VDEGTSATSESGGNSGSTPLSVSNDSSIAAHSPVSLTPLAAHSDEGESKIPCEAVSADIASPLHRVTDDDVTPYKLVTSTVDDSVDVGLPVGQRSDIGNSSVIASPEVADLSALCGLHEFHDEADFSMGEENVNEKQQSQMNVDNDHSNDVENRAHCGFCPQEVGHSATVYGDDYEGDGAEKFVTGDVEQSPMDGWPEKHSDIRRPRTSSASSDSSSKKMISPHDSLDLDDDDELGRDLDIDMIGEEGHGLDSDDEGGGMCDAVEFERESDGGIAVARSEHIPQPSSGKSYFNGGEGSVIESMATESVGTADSSELSVQEQQQQLARRKQQQTLIIVEIHGASIDDVPFSDALMFNPYVLVHGERGGREFSPTLLAERSIAAGKGRSLFSTASSDEGAINSEQLNASETKDDVIVVALDLDTNTRVPLVVDEQGELIFQTTEMPTTASRFTDTASTSPHGRRRSSTTAAAGGGTYTDASSPLTAPSAHKSAAVTAAGPPGKRRSSFFAAASSLSAATAAAVTPLLSALPIPSGNSSGNTSKSHASTDSGSGGSAGTTAAAAAVAASGGVLSRARGYSSAVLAAAVGKLNPSSAHSYATSSSARTLSVYQTKLGGFNNKNPEWNETALALVCATDVVVLTLVSAGKVLGEVGYKSGAHFEQCLDFTNLFNATVRTKVEMDALQQCYTLQHIQAFVLFLTTSYFLICSFTFLHF